MPSYSRQLLSGSVNGRTIPVAAVATPGTPAHTAIGSTGGYDEVYLWVANVTNAARLLTIEWGGTGNPADHMVHQVSIPANSPPIPIITGQVLQNGLTVALFADVAGALNATGFVNRIS
jgi:hypothetical protein